MTEISELICKHLINNSLEIQGSKHVHTLLRIHLLTYCKEISEYKLKLPLNIFDNSIRCENCFTSWSEGKFIIKQREKLTKSAVKRYKLIIKNKNKTNSLLRIQKAKQNLNHKILVVKCLICEKLTKVYIKNPIKVPKSINSNNNTLTKETKYEMSMNKSKNIKSKSTNKKYQRNNTLKDSFYKLIENSSSSKNNVDCSKNDKNDVKKKKHKDKFAGLCKIACNLATIENKKINKPTNKMLNVLLKPS